MEFDNCSALVVWNENCARFFMKYADSSWRRLSIKEYDQAFSS